MPGFVLLADTFQYNTKLLSVVACANGMVALGLGGVVPHPKTLGSPVKGKMKTPPGIVIVNTSVSVAVSLQGSVPPLLALMVMPKVPRAVGVPEIRPLVGSTVKPPGRPIASKLVGLLLAKI